MIECPYPELDCQFCFWFDGDRGSCRNCGIILTVGEMPEVVKDE